MVYSNRCIGLLPWAACPGRGPPWAQAPGGIAWETDTNRNNINSISTRNSNTNSHRSNHSNHSNHSNNTTTTNNNSLGDQGGASPHFHFASSRHCSLPLSISISISISLCLSPSLQPLLKTSAEKAGPSETPWHTYDGTPTTAWVKKLVGPNITDKRAHAFQRLNVPTRAVLLHWLGNCIAHVCLLIIICLIHTTRLP